MDKCEDFAPRILGRLKRIIFCMSRLCNINKSMSSRQAAIQKRNFFSHGKEKAEWVKMEVRNIQLVEKMQDLLNYMFLQRFANPRKVFDLVHTLNFERQLFNHWNSFIIAK